VAQWKETRLKKRFGACQCHRTQSFAVLGRKGWPVKDEERVETDKKSGQK